MNQLKHISKNSSKTTKLKASKTLNASDTFFKLATNDFYRNPKYINDSQHEPSIEFDIDDQVPSQIAKNNEAISQGINNKKQSRHPRNFSLPDISRIQNQLSADKVAVSGTIQEHGKRVPVSQSISGQDQLNSFNELASTQRGTSLQNSRVLNPSLTSLHPKDEVKPQQLRALGKLIVTQDKIEKKRQQLQKGILIKRDISHLSNSASKANLNSVIFADSQAETTPKLKPQKLFQSQNGTQNSKLWSFEGGEKENLDGKGHRGATSISEIGRSLPVSQSLERILVRRNTVNTKSEIPVDPISSFLDKVKNEDEEKSSTKREKNKAKMNYKTPRRNVSELHFALSSRRQLKDQENIIAEENENTCGDKTEERSEANLTAAAEKLANGTNFYKLFNNSSAEKLNPSEYLLHSEKKLTGLGTSIGPSVPRIWGLAGMSLHESLVDTEEKAKTEIQAFVADLKKHVPTALTNAPPSRQDAIGLNEWVEGKIDTVVKGNEGDIMKLWKCDTVYNLAVNEIIRQVSIDCGERGETLYHIWWNYLKMFAQFKQRVHIEDEKIREACQKESLKQQQSFHEILYKKDSEIEKLKAEIEKLEGDKKDIQAKCDKAMAKKTKYHQKADDIKRLLDKTKELVQELRTENEAYVRRLNKKYGPNGKPGHVPLYLAHHKQDREGDGASTLRSERGTHQVSERATYEAHDLRGRTSIGRSVDKKEKPEGLETSSDESDESSEDYGYDNLRVSNRPTYLNHNVVAFKGADKVVEETGSPNKLFGETKEIEVQTELCLVEGKYNEVLESQKTLEELLSELRLKQQVGDILNEAENIPNTENADKKQRGLAKSFSWYSLSHKSLMEDRIDGIGKFSIEKKKLKKHRGSFRSLKALGVSRCSSVHGSEPNSPSAKSNKSSQRRIEVSKGIIKSVTDAAYPYVEEEKKLQEKLPSQKSTFIHIESENNETVIEAGKVPSLKIFPSIQEQEEGKSTHRSQGENKEALSNLKPPFKTNFDDLEEARVEIEKTSNFNSLTQDALGHPSIDEGLDACPEEENQVIRPSRTSDFPDTPIKRKIPSLSRDFNTDSVPVSPRSYITDDLFQNLEDSDSDADSNDELDNEHRESMVIIEEAAEEDRGSPCRPRRREAREESPEIKLEPIPIEQKELKLSMATIVKLKMKASRVVNNMRREDAPMVDKAKLITVTRMYKVEKEKNSLLQKTISGLEEQLVNEKKCVSKAEESISDLRMHIKMLEDLKERCPHGKCPTCLEEQGAELKTQQEGFEMLGRESSNMWYTFGEGKDMLGSRQEVDSEIDNGSEISKVDNRIKRIKKLMKSNLMSQQCELSKKKEKEQKESFVASVIEKVKGKKIGKFKNFIPVSGVLKQISCLYNSRIALCKENVSLKDEAFGLYVYNWFLGSFGLRKIAEQKFVAFALSIKKHIHVVRINIFARFIGLLEGPVNYSLDELNKYLECVDFINNNSLGTTIVNQDTDTKHYAPFLRALDYIKHFAEDKMPLEEYTEFRQEFEALKEADPKNINKNGIVDIDLFMTKILTKYRIVCNRTKQFVINAFKASDLDNNKHCSLKEFIMIYRYIEPQKFDYNSAENLFYEKADAKIEGQLSLSFDKFTIVCVEYGLFSDAQQNLFLGLEAQSLGEQVQALQNSWVKHYQDIDMKIKSLDKTSQEEKKYWLNVLESIQGKIFKVNEENIAEFKPVLMAFKILELEVERLRDQEAKEAKEMAI